nr:putative late blight resistance protein homolog R1A-10 isoform X1 [Ipomoea batatas]
MAWFAVSSLMRTVELEFLSPNPHVVLDDTNAAEALHGRLRELLHFLEKSENQFNAEDVAMQDWKARLKDVALRIEDEIESKVIESCSRRQSTSTLAISSHYILGNAIEELTKSVREEYSQMKGILSSRERIESSSSSSSLPTASKLQSTMVGRTAELEQYLQTIYWLHPSQCTKEVFLGIRNVKMMGIFIPKRVGMEEFVYGLTWSNDKYYSLDENWLNDLINLRKLEKLQIKSHHDAPIILPHASAFPEQLRMLTLRGTLVPWDAMEVVGMLPNLEVLKLKSGACKGQHWKLSGDWFPKLKSLLIQERELKQWTATDNAFPILERLIIKQCIYLEKIPSAFVELYTLQLFELYGCRPLLVHSAKQIQQQQEELFGYNWLVLKYKASYPDSSYFARQAQEDEDSELTNVNFFNCFEDDFGDNDIN